MRNPLHRRHNGRHPKPDEPYTLSFGLSRFGRSAELHRKRNRLRDQNRNQEERVFEPGEEFHGSADRVASRPPEEIRGASVDTCYARKRSSFGPCRS